jgi:hypothetical protein
MHGTADPIVRIDPTRTFVAALRAAGHDVEFVEERDVGHTMTAAMNVRFETWLEEALSARAPGLRGGLGVAGPDDTPMEPNEPIEVDDDAVGEDAPLPPETANSESAETAEGEPDEPNETEEDGSGPSEPAEPELEASPESPEPESAESQSESTVPEPQRPEPIEPEPPVSPG